MLFFKEKGQKINLYLPIEGKARELAPKIYLAFKAVKKNFRVHIGTQESINRVVESKTTFGGVYFFKGGLDLNAVIKIKKKCSHFVILDEEIGPGDENPKETMLYRIDKSIENKIDRYYVLGRKTYLIAKKIFIKLKKKIVLSGWPRIDYFIASSKIKNNNDVNKLVKNHGKFILFISDYGQTSMRMVNFTKSQYQEKLDLSKKFELKKFKKINKSNLKTLKEFKTFISALKILDKDSSMPQIIVRPHPLEDHQPWERIKKSFKNIKVIFEGDIEQWIHASKGVIHKGCSSSIQVYHAQKPQGYLLLEKDGQKKTLVFKISHHLKSLKDVKEFCIKCVKTPQEFKKKNFSKQMDEIIHKPKKTSSDIIINDILHLKPIKETFPIISLNIKIKNYVRNLISNFNIYRFIISKIFLNIIGKYYISADNRLVSQHQKIPFGIKKNDVLKVLKNLNLEINDIKIESILKNLVILEKK